MQGLGLLEETILENISELENEDSSNALFSIGDYRRIQESLKHFEEYDYTGTMFRLTMMGEAGTPLEVRADTAVGLAFALVALSKLCRTQPNIDTLAMATLADTLVTGYRNDATRWGGEEALEKKWRG